jgi:fructose-1,6-bisphosphatase/inositol monophosphatase family enzyme
VDTDAITTLLQDVAAEVVTPRFRSLSADEVSEKNPGDLVTVADREAEVLITAALTRAYPDAVVLGEEASAGDPAVLDRYAAAEHAFTVDPVDGTRNFVQGSPDHAVMAAELRGCQIQDRTAWSGEPCTS